MDLTLRADSTPTDAIGHARTEWEARKAEGLDQTARDEAARTGYVLGEFEESEEDGAAVVEEFHPVDGEDQDSGGKPELLEKLRQKAGRNPSLISETAG